MAKILNLSNDIKINRLNIQPIDNYAYMCEGAIADEPNGAFKGYGTCTAIKITEHLMQFNYTYTITTNTNIESNYFYGLNANLLKGLNGNLSNLNLSLIWGGNCTMYDENWNIVAGAMGYAGVNACNENYWFPARNYNQTTQGGWASSDIRDMKVKFIQGTCYATY